MILAKNDILWELKQWNRPPNNILFHFLPYHLYKNRLHCAKGFRLAMYASKPYYSLLYYLGKDH